MNTDHAYLTTLADNEFLMEIGRRAVEDELVERRDDGIGIMRRNGLAIFSREGEPSSIIRMSTEDAVIIALKAIANYLKEH